MPGWEALRTKAEVWTRAYSLTRDVPLALRERLGKALQLLTSPRTERVTSVHPK